MYQSLGNSNKIKLSKNLNEKTYVLMQEKFYYPKQEISYEKSTKQLLVLSLLSSYYEESHKKRIGKTVMKQKFQIDLQTESKEYIFEKICYILNQSTEIFKSESKIFNENMKRTKDLYLSCRKKVPEEDDDTYSYNKYLRNQLDDSHGYLTGCNKFLSKQIKDVLEILDKLIFKQVIEDGLLENYNKLKEQDSILAIKEFQHGYYNIRSTYIAEYKSYFFDKHYLLIQHLVQHIESLYIISQFAVINQDTGYTFSRLSHGLKPLMILNDYFNQSIDPKKKQTTKPKKNKKKKKKNNDDDEENEDIEDSNEKKEDQQDSDFDDMEDLNMPQLSRTFTQDPSQASKRKQSGIKKDSGDAIQEEDDSLDDLEPLQLTKRFSQILSVSDYSLTSLFDFMMDNLINLIEIFIENSSDTSKRWGRLIDLVGERGKKMNKKLKFLYMRSLAKNRYNDDYYDYPEIQVKREGIYMSSLSKLVGIKPQTWISNQPEIKFDNEEGIDAGGPQREWLNLMLKEVFDPQLGLFQVSANKITLQPSPMSYLIPDHLIHFRIIGRIVAYILLNKWQVEIDFTKSFLKHLLKKDLYISDLDDIDPEQSNHLQWILKNPVEDLYLNFVYYHDQFGELKNIELMNDGSNIDVDESNKKDYVKKIAHYIMTDRIQEQTEAFIQGFYEVIPYEGVKLFKEAELGLYLAGIKKVDISDMKKHMKYGIDEHSDTVKWFWEVLESWDEEMKSQFLFFVTGTFKVPYGGFKEFYLRLDCAGDTDTLPVAHTCFRSIDMPYYSSFEKAKKFIEMAVVEGKQGFYIG